MLGSRTGYGKNLSAFLQLSFDESPNVSLCCTTNTVGLIKCKNVLYQGNISPVQCQVKILESPKGTDFSLHDGFLRLIHSNIIYMIEKIIACGDLLVRIGPICICNPIR